jgi:hypothetical protein
MSAAPTAPTPVRVFSLLVACFLGGCTGETTSAIPEDTPLIIQSLSSVTLTGVAGQPADPALRIRVVDGRGKPRASERVEFVATPGAGLITADILTDANGEATAKWTFSTKTGGYSVVAYADMRKTFLIFSAVIAAGPLARLNQWEFGHIDAVALAHDVMSGSASVYGSDTYGNAIDKVDVWFTVTAGGGHLGAALDSIHAITQSAGTWSIAQVGVPWTLGAVGVNQLTARAGIGAKMTIEVMALDSASGTWYVSPASGQLPIAKLMLGNNGYFLQQNYFDNVAPTRFGGTYAINGATLSLSGCSTNLFDPGDQFCYTQSGQFGQFGASSLVLNGRTYTRQ